MSAYRNSPAFHPDRYELFRRRFPTGLVERYLTLERCIRDEIAPRSGQVCRYCVEHCCQGLYCSETVSSPWLYVVARRRLEFTPPPNRRGSARRPWALGTGGCLFTVGRSKRCTEFNCGKVLAIFPDPITRFAYHCLSSILLYVSANFAGRTSLDDLLDAEAVTERRLRRLHEKIDEGFRLREDALHFVQRRHNDPHREKEAAERLTRLAARFPRLAKQSLPDAV